MRDILSMNNKIMVFIISDEPGRHNLYTHFLPFYNISVQYLYNIFINSCLKHKKYHEKKSSNFVLF